MGLQINFIVAIMILALWVTPAYAYLDPGTGSILLQGILAGIAAVMTSISLYWGKIKSFFLNLEILQKTKCSSCRCQPRKTQIHTYSTCLFVSFMQS
jgi:hypothetical protein